MARTAIWLAAASALLATPATAFNKPKREADAKVRTCPEVGDGYVRLPGSDTCIRLGGLVRVEAARIGGR